MIPFRVLRIVLAVFIVSGSSVQAMPDLFDLDVTSRLQINYDPFSGVAGNETLFINIEPSRGQASEAESLNGEQANNRFKLRISPSNIGSNLNVISNSGGALPISFGSSNRSGRLEKSNNGYVFNFSMNGASRKQQRFEFSLDIPPSLYADADRYFLSLDIEVLEADSQEVVALSRTVELEVIVKPKLQISLAGTRSGFNSDAKFSVVDFDVLETNESKQIFLQIRGNTQAHISVSSENHGKLRHTELPGAFIDYSINVDGTQSNLNSPLDLSRSVAKNFRGSNYPILISIGEVRGSFAGAYKDIITIDVEPQ